MLASLKRINTTGALLLVFACAFGLRITYLLQIRRLPFFEHLVLDPAFYDKMAQSIAAGNIVGDSVFFMSPVYPYFLAPIYAAFGHHLIAPRIVQALLGSLIPILVYFIGVRFFERNVALLASFLTAFSSIMIFHDGNLVLDHPLLSFLFLSSILLVLLARERDVPVFWVVPGLAFGITVVARASLLIVVMFVLLWMFMTLRPNWKSRAAIFAAGVILVTLSVAARNYAVGKDFVLITSNGGINFFIGNNEQASGRFSPPKELDFMNDPSGRGLVEELTGKTGLKPSEVSAYWYSRSFDFIRSDPSAFIWLLLRKLALYWSYYEAPQLATNYYFVKAQFPTILRLPLITFSIICPFALTGLVLTLRHSKQYRLLHLLIVGYVLSVVPFFVTSRYRVPSQPLLILFASYAIVQIARRALQRDYRKAAIVSSLVLSVVLLETQLNFVFDENFANDFYNLGISYVQQRDFASALEAFRKAEELAAEERPYTVDLAKKQLSERKYFAAFQTYRRSLRQIVRREWIYHGLGIAYEHTGQPNKAVAAFYASLQVDPQFNKPYINLGAVLARMKRLDEAEEILKKGVEVAPGMYRMHLNLGMVYAEKKKYKEAKEAFLAALELNPDLEIAKRNVAAITRLGY